MSPIPQKPLTLRRLLPPGDPATVEEIVEGLGLAACDPGGQPPGRRASHPDERASHPDERASHPGGRASHGDAPVAPAPPRPYVLLNMVSTADGRATIDGRSGPIGNRADRELFHGLRTAVDAVMAGAGTIRTERYGPIVAEESRRRARLERGLAAEPLACIVSGRLSLPVDIPLLADPQARVAILTPSAASLPGVAAQVDYVRTGNDGRLDLPAAFTVLSEHFGIRTLLCEGGPHLNSELLSAGLIDELFLTLAPKLSGGETPLQILAGAALEPPVEMDLLSVFESESDLFLRYRVVCSSASARAPAPARV